MTSFDPIKFEVIRNALGEAIEEIAIAPRCRSLRSQKVRARRCYFG